MRTFLLFLALSLAPLLTLAEEISYGRFSVDLPPHWDGESQQGFVTDNPAEYALTLGRKDDAGDKFLAQVTIYLLPNRPGVTAAEAARTLAEDQGNASEPEAIGNFWQFTGEPRTRTITGPAVTRVNADADYLLIIIAQDPLNLGAEELVKSLKGLTPEAQKLLGR